MTVLGITGGGQAGAAAGALALLSLVGSDAFQRIASVESTLLLFQAFASFGIATELSRSAAQSRAPKYIEAVRSCCWTAAVLCAVVSVVGLTLGAIPLSVSIGIGLLPMAMIGPEAILYGRGNVLAAALSSAARALLPIAAALLFSFWRSDEASLLTAFSAGAIFAGAFSALIGRHYGLRAIPHFSISALRIYGRLFHVGLGAAAQNLLRTFPLWLAVATVEPSAASYFYIYFKVVAVCYGGLRSVSQVFFPRFSDAAFAARANGLLMLAVLASAVGVIAAGTYFSLGDGEIISAMIAMVAMLPAAATVGYQVQIILTRRDRVFGVVNVLALLAAISAVLLTSVLKVSVFYALLALAVIEAALAAAYRHFSLRSLIKYEQS
ncbi:hypothetical protein ACFOMD_15690 [Sphingoaurantiacus capsulatus]|uniref:Polysaccharide biosynthesis protein n=1 Tax=Sphingoaurantiacus capsulatus TaxID=1771310 RepID=A0ABV7XH25_9SPHN